MFFLKRTLFCCLPLDERVCTLGILIASSCNCCVNKTEETLNHVLSMGSICKYGMEESGIGVWYYKHGSRALEGEDQQVVQNYKKINTEGNGNWFILVVIYWRIWLQCCKACMEDKQESGEAVWLAV